MKKIEHITLRSTVELKQGEDGKQRLIGLIPYNKRSEYLGFYEYITPTAFNKTLSDGADVKALWDHDSSKVLGRVKNNSLLLRSQEDGLYCEAILPDTSYARDAYNLIKDGYVQTLSFGFTPIQERVEIEDGNEVRYLTETKLSEISFGVPFPAYESTDSVARSLRGIDLNKLENILGKDALTEGDVGEITNTITQLNSMLPKEQEVKEDSVVQNTSAVKDTEAASQVATLNKLLDGLKEINGTN